MNTKFWSGFIAGGLLLAAPLVAQELPNGKAIYEATCAACHTSGVAGAPRNGDAAAWSARFERGITTLYANAIKGTGAMPARGGNATLTDAQVMSAVNYIAGQSAIPDARRRAPAKGAEPAKPAAAAAAGGGDSKGKLVYQASCAACHTSGLAGAPKLGDNSAWSARVAGGANSLYASATRGKGGMPAKGGNASLADADVRAAVDFIISQLRGVNVPGAASAAPAAQPAASAPAASAPTQVVVAPGPGAQDTGDPNAFNRLMTPPARRNAPPAEDGIHDAESPGTGLLQTPGRSFQALPKSNLGNYVDWVAALGKKQIQPRWDARDPKADPTVMDLNIVREVKGSMPDVVFPHKQHTEWLDCSNCHPAIFTPQKGANQISMAAIMLGQKCGVCHGKVAFPISECKLCHARQKTVATQTGGGGKP